MQGLDLGPIRIQVNMQLGLHVGLLTIGVKVVSDSCFLPLNPLLGEGVLRSEMSEGRVVPMVGASPFPEEETCNQM